MYSWEIENILKEKNFVLSASEYLHISDTEASKQISEVKYDGWNKKYGISTNDGYSWEFTVHPNATA